MLGMGRACCPRKGHPSFCNRRCRLELHADRHRKRIRHYPLGIRSLAAIYAAPGGGGGPLHNQWRFPLDKPRLSDDRLSRIKQCLASLPGKTDKAGFEQTCAQCRDLGSRAVIGVASNLLPQMFMDEALVPLASILTKLVDESYYLDIWSDAVNSMQALSSDVEAAGDVEKVGKFRLCAEVRRRCFL